MHRFSAAGVLAIWIGALMFSCTAQDETLVPEIGGPNLVANGDFDVPGDGVKCPFSSWTGRSGQGGQYTFKLVAGRTVKAAQIEGTVAGRGDIHTTDGFTVPAGETVRLRFWSRAENMKGGAFVNLEGEPNDDGWFKLNIDPSADWKLHEVRVKVPKGAKGQLTPRISLWIYHFGTGSLFIDDLSLCVVKPDPAGVARQELDRLRVWLHSATDAKSKADAASLNARLDAALADPKPETVEPLRKDVLAAIGAGQGSDGSFAVGVATSLEKVFLDEPYRGAIAPALQLSLARNESESAQAIIISTGKELSGLTVEIAGDLTNEKAATLPKSQVQFNLVGYVDTSKGQRPYQSSKLGWWPDPLLPNAPFTVKAGELQPIWITVTTTAQNVPGTFNGKVLIKSAGTIRATLPLVVEVFNVTLPQKPVFATFALGASPDVVAKFYGGDPGEKIMERFAVLAAQRHLPPVGLLNGWNWKAPKYPNKPDGSFDFARLDRWIDVLKSNGLTRFPIAVAPRFKKFGGGEYSSDFKRELGAFVHAYAEHLKEKQVFDGALFYNIDEASEGLGEWEVCKALHATVKLEAPGLPVVQCLNEFKGVTALAGHADIWDLYFGQYDQAGGPARQKAGDAIFLSVCVWPSEHPNLFIEYPALDARIMPWICQRMGAKGSEYWDLFAGWNENAANPDWWKSGDGTRTAWKLLAPTGDGLMIYPGPNGQPISSIRLEAYRDGVEDYGYLSLLADRSKTDAAAAALLKEATHSLVTGVTSYDLDPKKLLGLRQRILQCLSTHGE